MKKTLTLLLAFALVFTNIGVNAVYSAPSEEEVLPKYKTECNFLDQLGVLPESFEFGAEITRGDFAYMIARLLYDISFAENTETAMFNDISPEHKYYSEIKALKNMQIISGFNGNVFYPDDLISVQDAVAVIIKALSYEQYTESFGGYPAGYLYLAKLIGLYKDVDNLSGYLDFDTAAKLVYNALFIDTVNIDYITEDGISFSINEGKNVLAQFLGIKQYDGILSNDGISSFDGREIEFGKNVVIRDFKTNDEYIFLVGDSEIKKYFGQRLTVFTKENNDREEIIFYEVNKNVRVTELSGDKIVNFANSYIEYEVSEEDADYSKISFGANKFPDVFINGEKKIDYTSSDFKNPDSRIVFIDNNDDKKADVINIYRYDTTIVVNSITDGYITDKGIGGKTLDLSEEKALYGIIYSNKHKSLDDIRINDVINVAKSPKTINGKNVYYLSITSSSVSGMLEAKNEEELVIDGKIYQVAPFLTDKIPSLKFEKIKGYKDTFGRIVYFEKTSGGRNYAYVLRARYTEDVLSPSGIVRLFTANGDAETYDISEKVTVNGNPLSGSSGIKNLVEKLQEATEELIVYELNDKGEISNITFAQPFDTDEKNNENRFVYVKQTSATPEAYSGYSFGGLSVSGAVCFNISANYDSDGKGCEVFSMRANQYYSNVKLYDLKYDGSVGAALIKGAATSGGFQKAPADVYIFEKITDCITPEGDRGKKIYYYNCGVRGSVMINQDATKVTMSDAYIPQKEYIYEKIEDLKFGDIFTYETDSDGYLNAFCKLYEHQPDEEPDEDGKLFLSGSGGTGTAKDIFMVQGNIRYRSSDKFVVTLNAAELTIMQFSRTGGEQACVVDTVNKKIKTVPVDRLTTRDFNNNIPGDNVIVQASRHKLKEVIIYE